MVQCLIDGERVHVAGGRARARLRHTRSAHPAGPRDKRRPAPDRLAAAPCCPRSPTVPMPRGTPDPKTTTIAAAPTYAKTGRAGRRNRTRGIPPHRTCWTGRSRSSSGAEMTCDLIIWSATLRAEMAVLRVTCRTRSDSTIPSRVFGVTVLIWANGRARRSRRRWCHPCRGGSIRPVGCGGLEDLEPGIVEESEQSGTVGAGALDADPGEVAVAAHPAQHGPIAGAGGGQEFGRDNPRQIGHPLAVRRGRGEADP